VTTVPPRPEGANPADPPRRLSAFDCRWSMLGLADGRPDERLPEQEGTADVLAAALMAPGAEDPIEGIVEAVRVELGALAALMPDREVQETLRLLCRRLDAALLLFRRCDNRAPMPLEREPEADQQPPPPPTPKAKPRKRAR
jgi:hypothetical protein